MRNRISLNESQLHKVIKESVKKIIKESWMQIEEIDDAYSTLMNAINSFESTVMERAESVNCIWDDDERTEPSEFFIPQEDLQQLKHIAKKIKDDYSKSRTRDIGRYMRDENGFFVKS